MVKTSVKGTGQVLHGCASGGNPVSLDTSLPRPASIRLPICRSADLPMSSEERRKTDRASRFALGERLA